MIAVASVLVPLSTLLFALNAQPTLAQTGNTELNFQGRLLTDTGTLVPDGDYHIEFKLYDSLSGGASAQGVCVGGGTDDCVWVETRTTGNLVTVQNGYFSVNLGSVTAFGAIDWSQDLWLTMNIGGTSGPSWDGEMTPRTQVGTVPNAFNAQNVRSANVDGGNSNNVSVTTGDTTTSGNSGNLTVSTGTAVGTSGNISIDVGNGTSSDGTITLGAANASALTLGRAGLTTSNAGALTVTELLTASADLAVNGGDITTNQTTFNLLNTTATTVNAFGAATALDIGSTSGYTSINNELGIGTNDPDGDGVNIQLGSDVTVGGNNGYLVLGDQSGENLALDINEIQARNNGANATLHLQADGANVQIGQNTDGGLIINSTSEFYYDSNNDLAVDTDTLFVDASAGGVGFGTTSPDAAVEIAGNRTQAAWGLNGIQLQGTAATFTDSSTAASGTATSAVFTSFGIPTLAATNTSVTTTNAANVYIAGAPAAGTNQTITNAYALWVDAGNVRIDDSLTVSGASNQIGDAVGDSTTIESGTLKLSSAAAFQNEGTITLGRIDDVARDNEIVYYNDSTQANNYIGLNVHTGVLGTTDQVLRAYGDGRTQLGDGGLQGSLVVADGSSNYGTLVTTALGSDRTYTLPDTDGTVLLNTTTSVAGVSGFVQGGNSWGATAILGTNDAQSLQFEVGGVDALTIADGGAITVQNETDSTGGFQVLDANGSTSVFNVDTTNERVGIRDDTPEYALDVEGIIAASNSGNNAEIFRLDHERAWSFFQRGTGSGAFLDFRSEVGDKEFTITNTDGEVVQRIIAGNAAGNDNGVRFVEDRIQFSDSGGITLTAFTSCTALETNGSGVLACGTDDTGGSGVWQETSGVINLTTPGNTVTVGSSTNLGKLAVDGDADEVQLLVQGHSTQTTNDLVAFENSGGTDLFSLSGAGSALFQNATDSTTGFQILDTDGGTPILNVDTTNERVGIGTASPGTRLEVRDSAAVLTVARDYASDNNTARNVARFVREYSGGAGADGIGARIGFQVETETNGTVENAGFLNFIATDATAGTIDSDFTVTTLLDATENERLRVTSAGNVGIGTSTPSIDIGGGTWDANGVVLEVENTAGNARLVVDGDVPVIALADRGGAANEKIATISVNNDQFRLVSANDDGTLRTNDILVADLGTGNVGIGDPTPDADLDIERGAEDASIRLNQSGTVAAEWEIRNNETTGRFVIGEIGNNTPFKIANNASENLLRLGVTTANQVEIGTSTNGGGLAVTDNSATTSDIVQIAGTGLTNGNALQVTGTSTNTADEEAYLGSFVYTANPGAASETRFAAIYGETTTTQADNIDRALTGVYGVARNSATSGTLNTLRGVYGRAISDGAATVTNAYALQADNPSVTAGTITNNVGIFVNAKSQGTNNAGIIVAEASNGNNANLVLGQTTIPAGSFSLYSSSTDDSYFAGNVGIGTTGPASILEVAVNTDGSDTVATLTNEDASFVDNQETRLDFNQAATTVGRIANYYDSASDSFGFNFYGYDGGLNTTPNLTLQGDGNVGIGTATPSFRLEVVDDVAPIHSHRAYATDGNTARSVLNLTRSYNGGTGADGIGGRIVFQAETETEGTIANLGWLEYLTTDATAGTVDSDFAVYTVANNSSTEKLRVTSTGNVGIGSTNPQGTLDLGNGTNGRSIVWAGSTGANFYNAIGSSYSGADLVLAQGTRLGTASDTQTFGYTGTYAVSGTVYDRATGDIYFYNNPSAARTAGNAYTYSSDVRLTVDGPTGNVGIGTISPSELIHVSSTGNIFGLFESTDDNAVQLRLKSENTNRRVVALDSNDNTESQIILGDNGQFEFAAAATTTTPFTIQGGAPDDSLWLASTGNVGIGDASPDHALDVDGNIGQTAGSYINYGDTSGSGGYGFRDNGGTLEVKNSGGGWNPVNGGVGGSGTTNRVAYWTSTGNIGADDDLFFDGVDVGIGTTSPQGKLHVNDGTATQSIIGFDENVNGYGEVLFRDDTDSASKWSVGAISDLHGTYPNDFYIFQYTDDADAAVNQYRLVVTNAGNVGIGDRSPGSKLEVAGTVRSDVSSGQGAFEVRDGGTLSAALIDASGAGNIGYLQLFSGGTQTVSIQASGNSYINTAGDIGFGTATPNYKLEVVDNSAAPTIGLTTTGNFSPQIIGDADRGAANQAVIALKGNWDGTQIAGIVFRTGDDTTNKDDGDIIFQTAQAGVLSEQARITQEGNVGIGVTSPTGILEVDGGTGGTGITDISLQASTGSQTASGNSINISGGDVLGLTAIGTGGTGGSITLTAGDGGTSEETGASGDGGDLIFNTGSFGGGSGSGGSGSAGSFLVNLGAGSTSNGMLQVDSPLNAGNFTIFQLVSDVGGTNNVKLFVDTDGDINTDGGITVTGNSFLNGDVEVGNSSTDNITINGRVDSDIIPDADDTYDLGSSTLRWQDLYLGPASLHIGTDGDEGILSYNTTDDQFIFDQDLRVNGGFSSNWASLNVASNGTASIMAEGPIYSYGAICTSNGVGACTGSNGVVLGLTNASAAVNIANSGNSFFNTGNLGVGDTTPTYKLDVAGTGRFTDELTVDTKIIAGGSEDSYGSLTIDGSKSNYSGIHFEDVTGSGDILMVHNTAGVQGFWDATGGWDWYFDDGVLTVGSVPAARITSGTVGTGNYTFNGNIIFSDDSITGINELQFNDGSNFSIGSNTDGLLFDGGDGTLDFLVYDNNVYSDSLLLGYSGSALLTTYDANEDLQIDPNGSGQVQFPSGTGNSDPGISFVGDTDLGFYRTGADSLRLVAGGSDRLSYSGGVVYVGGGSGTANLQVDGTVSSCTLGDGTGNTACTSDQRKKNTITSTSGNLAKINQLNPVSYYWNSDPGGPKRLGLVAQEVLGVFPEVVITGGDGFYKLDYSSLVSPLIGAVQELTVVTDDLDTRLAVVESGQLQTLTVSTNATIQGNLTVQGNTQVQNITVNGKIVTAGNTPTAVLGSATTGQGSTYSIEGNDTAGSISITTGTNTPANPLAAGDQITITFDEAFALVPRITLTPTDAESANVHYFVTKTATKFVIHFTDIPAATTTYSFDYQILQ